MKNSTSKPGLTVNHVYRLHALRFLTSGIRTFDWIIRIFDWTRIELKCIAFNWFKRPLNSAIRFGTCKIRHLNRASQYVHVYRLHALRLLTCGIRTFFQKFSTIFSSTLVVYILTILDTPRDKISTNHESEQTLGTNYICMASIFWHNIPSYLKNLNAYQFSKQIKLSLFSDQLENSMKYPAFWTFNSFECPVLIWFGLSPRVCTLFTHLYKYKRQGNSSKTARFFYPPDPTLSTWYVFLK